jgi:hypothetical protein
MRGKVWARVAAAVWTAVIILGTVFRATPTGEYLRTMGAAHIAAHGVVFAILGALLVIGFVTPRARGITLVAAGLLGASTEVYEHLAFHGPMEYIDMFTNMCGVLLGCCITFAVQESLKRH